MKDNKGQVKVDGPDLSKSSVEEVLQEVTAIECEKQVTAFGAMDTTVTTEDGIVIICSSVDIKSRERIVSFEFPLGLDINPLEIDNKDVYIRFKTEDNKVRYPILLEQLKYDTFHMNISVNDVVISKTLYYKAKLIIDLDNLPQELRDKYER